MRENLVKWMGFFNQISYFAIDRVFFVLTYYCMDFNAEHFPFFFLEHARELRISKLRKKKG